MFPLARLLTGPLGHLALGRQRLEGLLDKKRIATRGLVETIDQPLGNALSAQGSLQEITDLIVAQGVQGDFVTRLVVT